MIFNEIKCHVNTFLGLVGGMYPLHLPCVRAWTQYLFRYLEIFLQEYCVSVRYCSLSLIKKSKTRKEEHSHIFNVSPSNFNS